MQIIPLQKVPNQTFNVTLNGADYRIAIRTIQLQTYMTVWIDGNLLFYNQLCTPNNWVNVYNYISVNGKLYFNCLENNYPSFPFFGDTQTLLFYTPEEVEALNENA